MHLIIVPLPNSRLGGMIPVDSIGTWTGNVVEIPVWIQNTYHTPSHGGPGLEAEFVAQSFMSRSIFSPFDSTWVYDTQHVSD
jgi:hypothetical protein